MQILSIETSTKVGSVALLRDETCLAEKTFGAKQRHSAGLVPAVEKVLAKAKVRAEQIDLWAVGLGPGSFLGIRVGIAAAKGFAVATGKPVVGVPSFDALAAEFLQACPHPDPLPLMRERGEAFGVVADAGRGELSFARYEREPRAQIRIIKPDELPSDLLLIGPDRGQHPRARFVALLARARRPEQNLEPIYLRETKFVKVGEKL